MKLILDASAIIAFYTEIEKPELEEVEKPGVKKPEIPKIFPGPPAR